MADAASPDPCPSQCLPAPGSDKADRGMADAASRGTAQCREKYQPPREEPIAKKVATSPNDTGAPRTESRDHVENAKSMDTIIIDDHDVKDTAQTADTKPGILANEKTAIGPKKAEKRKKPNLRHYIEEGRPGNEADEGAWQGNSRGNFRKRRSRQAGREPAA